MLKALLFVGIGGAAGSMARYGIGHMVSKFVSHPYPFATFFINIVGCFIIGMLFGYGQKQQLLMSDWWLILATGFCGGFTTFSSFALENISLLRSEQYLQAVLYTTLSVVLGLVLCRLGITLFR